MSFNQEFLFLKSFRISNILKGYTKVFRKYWWSLKILKLKSLKCELLLRFLGSFLSSTNKMAEVIGVLWCKCVYILFVPCPWNHFTLYFCSLECNMNFLGSLFPRIFCSFLNLTRVFTTTKIRQENKYYIKLNFPKKMSSKFLSNRVKFLEFITYGET
jgi:hypothetical protein